MTNVPIVRRSAGDACRRRRDGAPAVDGRAKPDRAGNTANYAARARVVLFEPVPQFVVDFCP